VGWRCGFSRIQMNSSITVTFIIYYHFRQSLPMMLANEYVPWQPPSLLMLSCSSPTQQMFRASQRGTAPASQRRVSFLRCWIENCLLHTLVAFEEINTNPHLTTSIVSAAPLKHALSSTCSEQAWAIQSFIDIRGDEEISLC